ncbi:visual pigment-like receptor peropsin [Ylistrum balloti]|uniref:visual pigment-like receptor peropsin n=1 Tax=Ylistrum balloti TaxID=509963 RepID=UPI002905A01E|nr:visual pigment-like receptor peropsin [Ylistrum balloti]
MFRNTSTGNYTIEVHQIHLPKYAYIVIGVLMMIASVIGITLNGLIVYVFCRQPSLKTPTNYFVLALSILDLLMSLFGIPMVVVSSFKQHWAFGDKGCVYYGFIMTFLGLSIITILAMISIDRYIVIVKTHLKPLINERVAVSLIFGCVLNGLAWAIAPLVGWSKYVLEGFGISCSVNWTSNLAEDASFSVASLVLFLVVPLGVFCFCYGNIFYKVRKSGNLQMFTEADRGSSKMDRDVAKTILWMILAFMMSWFPYATLTLITVIGGSSSISPEMTVCPTILAKISVIWNPLIYTYRNREIRKSMVELLPFLSFLFNLPCVRCQNHTQIRPDIYRNNAEGQIAVLPHTSTSTESTQTRNNRLQRQDRQLDVTDNECTASAKIALKSYPQSRQTTNTDMFTVHNVDSTTV